MISSLEKKPANGGTPAMASVAIPMVTKVTGSVLAQPAHVAHVLRVGRVVRGVQGVVHGVDHRAASPGRGRP